MSYMEEKERTQAPHFTGAPNLDRALLGLPEITKATQYITISVAEYHYLTKAAALLEVVVNDPTYNHDAVAAVAATIQDMRRTVEAGAEQ